MKIILHLGAHKTSTSSLQNVLSAKKNILEDNRIYFVDVSAKTNSLYRMIRNICELSISEKSSDQYDALFRNIRKKLYSIHMDNRWDTVLIPWEIFIGEPFVKGKYKLYGNAPKCLDCLSSLFKEHSTFAVYVIRNQWEFINSWYRQLHKIGHPPEISNYRYWAKRSDLSWVPIGGEIKKRFPQTKFISYDCSCFKESLLDSLNLKNVVSQHEYPNLNHSWPDEALQIARHAMPKMPTTRDKERLRAVLNKAFENHVPSRWNVLNQEYEGILRAQYKLDIETMII